MSQQYYVVAQYSSIEEANVGLQVLDKLGLDHSAISLVARSNLTAPIANSTTDESSRDQDLSRHDEAVVRDEAASVVDRLKAPESQQLAAGAGAGAALATGLALPLSISTAVAPFFIAGPLVAAVVGAIGGATIGAGQAKDGDDQDGDQAGRTTHYRQLVEQGATLVIYSGNRAMALEAERGLKTTHAQRVELLDGEAA